MSERFDVTHVYILAALIDGVPSQPVKVGISSAPEKRLATIQTSCPYPLVLLSAFLCPTRNIALYVENAFHTLQADRRLNGEWFNIHPMNAVELLCLYFREIFNFTLSKDAELFDAAVERSGLALNERRLAQWKEHLARQNPSQSHGDKTCH